MIKNYELEQAEVQEKWFKVEGNSVLVNESLAENVAILRVSDKATKEQIEHVEKLVEESGLKGKAIVVPHWVTHLKAVPIDGTSRTVVAKACVDCGGTMVRRGQGYICVKCGYESVIDGIVSF